MGVWKHDDRILLEPKAVDVLRHLVANRDRLVTKDELLDCVWKDTFVTPNALTRAIAQLRKSLGDDVEHPKLIETITKRGYRFVAPVTIPPPSPTQTPAVASNGHAEPAIPTATPVSLSRQPTARGRARAVASIGGLFAVVLLVGWLVAAPRTSRPTAPLNITSLT